MKAKNYNIKVYTLAGVYVSTFSPSIVMTGVSFTAQKNGGQGEMRARLNIPFASAAIAYNNIVKVYEADDANPNGRQIYMGIVGSLQRVNENGAEYVEMRALGLASMLSWIYYDSAGTYEFSKNQEPTATITDAIDRFSIKYPGLITYTGSTAELTGTVANLSFSYDKASDAIKKATATASQWWWTIDGTGTLQFHPKTGAVGQTHHKLDFSGDVDGITVEENLEKLVNTYILTYTGGTVTSTDGTSQSAYGIRELRETKTEITNGTTATNTAVAYVAQNKNPTRRITLTINSQYDFESIRPGDLVTVRNFDYSISSLQISKIEYNPGNMKIELEDILSFANEVLTN